MNTKSIILSIALSISIFTLNIAHAENEEVAEIVKQSIYQEFQKDPNLSSVRIENLTLLRESGNRYRGLLEITSEAGIEKTSITVITDGDTFMWEID